MPVIATRRIAAFVWQLPARVLLGLVWFYQKAVSPAVPVILGPSFGCRFAPSCSHYAAGALREHGAVVGSWLALVRLLKCNPLHAGGLDPVPPRRTRSSFTCSRVSRTAPASARA